MNNTKYVERRTISDESIDRSTDHIQEEESRRILRRMVQVLCSRMIGDLFATYNRIGYQIIVLLSSR